jgi:hypothetical protein
VGLSSRFTVRKCGERGLTATLKDASQRRKGRKEKRMETRRDGGTRRVEKVFSPSIFIIRMLSIDGFLTMGTRGTNVGVKGLDSTPQQRRRRYPLYTILRLDLGAPAVIFDCFAPKWQARPNLEVSKDTLNSHTHHVKQIGELAGCACRFKRQADAIKLLI